MPRRTAVKVASTILATLGLASIAGGLFADRIWAQPDQVIALTPADAVAGSSNAIVSSPGVLNLVGDDVTIRASVPNDQPVTLVVGRDVDVDGWVGDGGAARVTGLTDWQSLAVAAGAPGAETLPDPAGSDLWVAEASGDGSAEMNWQTTPGRWSLLAVGGGAQPSTPQLELTWPKAAANPLRWPLIGSGIALTAIAGALALFGPRKPEPVPVIDVVPSEPVASDWSQIIGETAPAPGPVFATAPPAPVATESQPTEIIQPVPVQAVPLAPPPAPIEVAPVPVTVVQQPPVEIVQPAPVRVSVVPEMPQPTPAEPIQVAVVPAVSAASSAGIVGQGRVFASSASFDVPPTTRREAKLQRRAAELTGTVPIVAAVTVDEWPEEWEREMEWSK